MNDSDRTKYLRIALLVVGLIFIFGIYPLTILWPSGWSWNAGQSEYLQMILGIYATLGVFLVACRRVTITTSGSSFLCALHCRTDPAIRATAY